MRTNTALLILVGLAVVSCTSSQEEPARETLAAAAIEPIPLTTSSEEALTEFEAGRSKLDVGRAIEAREHFQRAIDLDADFSMAYLSLANSAFSPQEYKENLDLAIAHIDGKSAGERLLIEVSKTYLTSDADERLKLSLELTETYPRSPRAWMALGYARMGRREHEESRTAIRRALELDPEFLGAYFGLWNSYLFGEPKDFDQALAAMEASLAIAGSEAQIHQNLGDTYRAREDLETARRYYSQAIELDTHGSVASVSSLKKGHINSFLGNFDEARADYDKGLAGAAKPNQPSYANYRAFTYLHADDPEAALDELEALLDSIDGLDLPEHQKLKAREFTLSNAAVIALHTGLLDRAKGLLARLAAVLRASAELVGEADFARQQEGLILLWRGQLEARSGDFETATATAEALRELRAEDRDPRRFEGYHGLMGLIDLLREDYAPAVEHFRQSDVTEIYVKYHLALAEAGAGRPDEARKLFAEVGHWNFNSVGFALVRRDALARSS